MINLKKWPPQVTDLPDNPLFHPPRQDFLNVFFGPGQSPHRPTARLPRRFVCHAMHSSTLDTCSLVDFSSCGLKPWHRGATDPDEWVCGGPAGESGVWVEAAIRWRETFGRVRDVHPQLSRFYAHVERLWNSTSDALPYMNDWNV